MRCVESAPAEVVSFGAELAAVVCGAKRDRAHIAARVWQVVDFHWTSAADQATELGKRCHALHPLFSGV
jgi:hypothetical protein